MRSYQAALIQLDSRDDKAANLAAAKELVERAAGRGARLIALPETMNFIGRGYSKQAEPIPGGETCELFRELAQKHGVWIETGSIPQAMPGGGSPRWGMPPARGGPGGECPRRGETPVGNAPGKGRPRRGRPTARGGPRRGEAPAGEWPQFSERNPLPIGKLQGTREKAPQGSRPSAGGKAPGEGMAPGGAKRPWEKGLPCGRGGRFPASPAGSTAHRI